MNGSQSFILHQRARRHEWQGAGWLSIKSFVAGEALYQAEGGRFRLDAQRYMLLNDGQEYRIEIDAAEPVESFCIFFSPELVRDGLQGLNKADGDLLAEPDPGPLAIPTLPTRSYLHDEAISPRLRALRSAYPAYTDEPAWLDEQLLRLLPVVLQLAGRVRRQIGAFPAANPATRKALYQRAHIAREHILACYAEPLSLQMIAAAVNMSPNHLLRVFRKTFGLTPHRYLTRVRLARAEQLLKAGKPVTETCLQVGFSSLGSFSHLFRRHFGFPPSAIEKGDFREARQPEEA
ncbi:MAG: helix-turn-helix transcriptional regulator [Anaerolineales bacterium]|nr:helix-turn-helix transcriptional regulator [Anaerolineales bacterium]